MSSDPKAVEPPLGRVAILGLGLMGGSLARAISGLQLAERVTGWSPNSTERDAALTAGAVTFAAAGWREAVKDADLVIIAAPLEATRRLISELVGAVPDEATVTDVASLKAPVAESASAAGLGGRWVGSHPMAGGEDAGFWASRADLFSRARVWTVQHEADDERLAAVHGLWSALGASPSAIQAAEHDHLMSLVSHLPQLIANAIAEALQQAGVSPHQLGPGGRDMTRLAGSSPEMWWDILEHSSPSLIGSLRSVAATAERLADAIEAGEVESVDTLMRRTRAWRAK